MRKHPKPRQRRRRSEFVDQFYRGADAARRGSRSASGTAAAGIRRRRKKKSLLFAVGSLGILFSVILVGGSSAIIWLRKLGALFGVHFIGD